MFCGLLAGHRESSSEHGHIDVPAPGDAVQYFGAFNHQPDAQRIVKHAAWPDTVGRSRTGPDLPAGWLRGTDVCTWAPPCHDHFDQLALTGPLNCSNGGVAAW